MEVNRNVPQFLDSQIKDLLMLHLIFLAHLLTYLPINLYIFF